MGFQLLNLKDAATRLEANGFGHHAMHNLCALAASGGVAQLRVLNLVASVTMFVSRFRVDVVDDGPARRHVDTFMVEPPDRACRCEPRRHGPCDLCWEQSPRRQGRVPLV